VRTRNGLLKEAYCILSFAYSFKPASSETRAVAGLTGTDGNLWGFTDFDQLSWQLMSDLLVSNRDVAYTRTSAVYLD